VQNSAKARTRKLGATVIRPGLGGIALASLRDSESWFAADIKNVR